jgi:hypothetical protein
VAVDVFILAVGVMKSTTPFSARTYIVTDHNYPLALTDIVVGLVSPEVVFCVVFCDGLPTVKCSVHSHLNRIVRVERAETTLIAPVECVVPLRHQRSNLLFYSLIDRVFLLGKDWQIKGDCQPY